MIIISRLENLIRFFNLMLRWDDNEIGMQMFELAENIEVNRKDLRAAVDEIKELFETQIMIMIELDIKRGSRWKEQISEPYKKVVYDFAQCQDDCPIPLPWTSWSCHCIKVRNFVFFKVFD